MKPRSRRIKMRVLKSDEPSKVYLTVSGFHQWEEGARKDLERRIGRLKNISTVERAGRCSLCVTKEKFSWWRQWELVKLHLSELLGVHMSAIEVVVYKETMRPAFCSYEAPTISGRTRAQMRYSSKRARQGTSSFEGTLREIAKSALTRFQNSSCKIIRP
jgi:hypothetical protein